MIAGNEILAEHLAAYSDAITVVPSLVDPTAYAIRAHEQGEAVTLGWIGSPTTAPYLRGIARRSSGSRAPPTAPVRLLVVGGAAPAIAGVRVEERVWSPRAEREALAEMDIGLMPLEDTPWTRGKCAYKALQYMAAGIPPVADDVGVSGRHRRATPATRSPARSSGSRRWRRSPRDAGLRARLGVAGRRRVEEEFSPARWLPTIAAIMRGDQ